MGEIHELFVLALSLVWFAGATPERKRDLIQVHTLRLLTAWRRNRTGTEKWNRWHCSESAPPETLRRTGAVGLFFFFRAG